MTSTVAIVGRPNVGKSTLFNRLVGGRHAIVDEFSGVTRDRLYGMSNWNGKDFNVIDTGGYVQSSDDIFDKAIRKQVEAAIEEAQILLFILDVTIGITDLDDQVAEILRRSGKDVVVVANKVDNNKRIAEAAVFYGLGLGEVFNISSINGTGTGELLDRIAELADDSNEPEEPSEIPRFAVVGRPNAGKSSFINTLIGEDRNVVTPIAGTTRDSTDIHYKGYGFDFKLVDTAGIRKKAKVHEDLEFYSVMRAIRSIEGADVCFLMIDAVEGIGTQDINIFSLAEKNRKGIVILINKWDLVEKETETSERYKAQILEKIAPFKDVDIVFISVLEKQRIFKALEAGISVYKNRVQKLKTAELNDHLLPIIQAYPPPAIKGKYVKIKFITQLPSHVPAFAFFCSNPKYVKESYRRFLENKMREKWNFSGVPIKLFFRQK